MWTLICIRCGETVKTDVPEYKCRRCGGIGTLEYKINYETLKEVSFTGDFTFWRYKMLLPSVKNYVTMQEGGTPLYRAERLAKHLDLPNLYLKDETRNPTNSFRDRAAALIVSNMLDLGYTAAICASNGNMGASLAAYCAKYGIACHIIIPKHVDVGKIAQMIIFDAIIEEYGETVDEAIERAERMFDETGWYQATSALNPLVIEAQKTIAFEIAEQIGVPDTIIVPMGSGGAIYSIWKGFKELNIMGKIDGFPRLVGVQSSGCSPIVDVYLGKEETIENPMTRATSIFVLNPSKKDLAIKAMKESRGLAVKVSDQDILEAEQEIAKMEGLFAEPASSGTIAALKLLINESYIDKSERVVCLITGSGLKATDVLQTLSKKRKLALIEADFSTKERILCAIASKKTYGYEIWKDIGRTMTKAAIYQHLNDLRNRGLISVQIKNGRKYFTITQRGRRVLKALDEVKILL
ncbi:threonine synthase [Candidatus Bathyarchaeota archaeon]|nr:threonine synthase [Candidatus Bathyarchaeota archaeon]